MRDTYVPSSLADVAVVVIGRNEGARLQACLTALRGMGVRAVYVDSASTDDSVAMARALGFATVELDPALPFTAARGRNAGVQALGESGPLPAFVQFIDGDCILDPAWLPAALAVFAADPDLSVVTGWRREKAPLSNAFHLMAEVEWHQAAGPIAACGGDMMVRSTAFLMAGGFDPRIIASEDEEFVQRVLKNGGKAVRLPRDMTLHDVAMTRLRAWWRRNLRSGNGLAEVGDLHPPHFRAERRRAVVYGMVLPLVLVIGALLALWADTRWIGLGMAGLALAAYLASCLRMWRWLRGFDPDAGWKPPALLALKVALLFTLSKLPQALGMIRYYRNGGRRASVRLIEYK